MGMKKKEHGMRVRIELLCPEGKQRERGRKRERGRRFKKLSAILRGGGTLDKRRYMTSLNQ